MLKLTLCCLTHHMWRRHSCLRLLIQLWRHSWWTFFIRRIWRFLRCGRLVLVIL
jgi:hypothetical protein